MITENSKPSPILATYDRHALLGAIIRLCYGTGGDSRGCVYERFINQWMLVEPDEIAKACTAHNMRAEYLKTNEFGKIAHACNPSPEEVRRAYLWVLRKPEKLALLLTIHDILKANGHHWGLAERILHEPITNKPSKFKALQQKACDQIIKHLSNGDIVSLFELEGLTGKDCRDFLLDLRSIGHKICLTAEYDFKLKQHKTMVYLSLK